MEYISENEENAMRLIKTYTDGDYTVNEYDNGTIERYLTGSDQPIEVPQVMSKVDEAILDTNIKITYLECLAKLNAME